MLKCKCPFTANYPVSLATAFSAGRTWLPFLWECFTNAKVTCRAGPLPLAMEWDTTGAGGHALSLKILNQGLEYVSVHKVLASQTWGLEFEPQIDLKKKKGRQSVCNPSTGEADTGRFPKAQWLPGCSIHDKFYDNEILPQKQGERSLENDTQSHAFVSIYTFIHIYSCLHTHTHTLDPVTSVLAIFKNHALGV